MEYSRRGGGGGGRVEGWGSRGRSNSEPFISIWRVTLGQRFYSIFLETTLEAKKLLGRKKTAILLSRIMCTASRLIIHLCTFSPLWKRKALRSLGSTCNLRLQFIGQATPEQSILEAGGAQARKKLLARTLKSGFLNVKYSHLFKWRGYKSMEVSTELAELEWGIVGLGISSLLKAHQLVSKHVLTVKQEPQNPLSWQFPRKWGPGYSDFCSVDFMPLSCKEAGRFWTSGTSHSWLLLFCKIGWSVWPLDVCLLVGLPGSSAGEQRGNWAHCKTFLL